MSERRRSDGGRGRGGGGGGGGGNRRWRRRPRKCYFCTEGLKEVNYKSADMLRRFVNDRGKIRPRRQTGTCARHQRKLARAIKRARHLALLPFAADSVHRG